MQIYAHVFKARKREGEREEKKERRREKKRRKRGGERKIESRVKLMRYCM